MLSTKTKLVITWAVLALDVFIGATGLFAATAFAKVAEGRISVWALAACFGVAALSLLCNAVLLLLECRTGPMPMAFSKNRPFVWVAIIAVAAGILTLTIAKPQ